MSDYCPRCHVKHGCHCDSLWPEQYPTFPFLNYFMPVDREWIQEQMADWKAVAWIPSRVFYPYSERVTRARVRKDVKLDRQLRNRKRQMVANMEARHGD